MKYQVFSERCSGSNYIQAVLASNLPDLAPSSHIGFKHWITTQFLASHTFPADLMFLIINRNPFHWLRSIHAQPWHCAQHLRSLPFSDFIRAEWQCVWDDQAGIGRDDPRWMQEMAHERNPLNEGSRYCNIIEARKVKYHIWRSKLQGHPGFVPLSFDQFLKAPGLAVNRIAQLTCLPEPPAVVLPPGYKGRLGYKRKLMLRLSMGLIGKAQAKPMAPISLADLEFIVHNLNKAEEMAWGYDIDDLVRQELAYTEDRARYRPFPTFHRQRRCEL